MATSTADAYDALVASLGTIDLVHLGLGADGHTASLFPGTAALDVTDRLVVENGDARHPHRRMTFTFPGIARAAHAVFTVEGDAKRDAFTRVLAGHDLPAARVTAARVTWLVSRELATP
jgi:6-phosphogluconolactonase/glucosamine-6-phosphate isomerase/deaminase